MASIYEEHRTHMLTSQAPYTLKTIVSALIHLLDTSELQHRAKYETTHCLYDEKTGLNFVILPHVSAMGLLEA